MPPSGRITFRLTPTLAPLVDARVRQGRQVSDTVREALEAYFGLRQTQGAAVSASTVQVADTMADRVFDLASHVSDVVSAVSDIRGRLAQLEARMDALPPRVRQRPTHRPTPRSTTAYDPTAALTRMQALRAEGRSLAQIAVAPNAEGLPTRHGKPWHKGTAGYLLQSS